MDTDAAHQPLHGHEPDISRLPRVLEVSVRRRAFDPARRITEQGRDRAVSEAVEITLRLSEPFEIRALNPVLWVGEEPLAIAEMERADQGALVRFFGFDPDALRSGAPMSLSWSAGGAQRVQTGFTFQEGEAAER